MTRKPSIVKERKDEGRRLRFITFFLLFFSFEWNEVFPALNDVGVHVQETNENGGNV